MYNRRSLVVIFLLWCLCTAFNITKAVHIDDTVYLLVAQQIQEHPLRPYSGSLNWSNAAGPTHTIAQPPLLSFLFAGGFALFGESEVLAHLILSLFTLGVILCFHKLLILFNCRQPLYALALLVLGPVFIPSQNLMTDIPTLFFWLLFFLLLVSAPESTNRYLKFAGAGLAAGFACLTKYISAVLLAIFLLVAMINKQRAFKWIAITPFLILSLWLLFTYLDYGGLHLFSKVNRFHFKNVIPKACDYMVCLGGLAPFSLLFIPIWLKDKKSLAIICILILLACILFPVEFLTTERIAQNQLLFTRAFWLNGIFTFCSTLILLYKEISAASLLSFLRSKQCILYLWIIGSFVFVIMFAPYVAARHVLTMLPAIILVIVTYTDRDSALSLRIVTLIITAFLGLALSVSDWSYANVYRRMALQLREELGSQANIISVGHWGWQWYAEKSGMITYDKYRTHFKVGDFVVMPTHIHRQTITREEMANIELMKTIKIPASELNWIRSLAISPFGGLYSSVKMMGPWRISMEPLEEFYIYKARSKVIEWRGLDALNKTAQ